MGQIKARVLTAFELSFEDDLAAAQQAPEAARWKFDRKEGLEVWVTVSPDGHPEDVFVARLHWIDYPGNRPQFIVFCKVLRQVGPIRARSVGLLFVPFAAGGPTDILARTLALLLIGSEVVNALTDLAIEAGVRLSGKFTPTGRCIAPTFRTRTAATQ